MWKNLPEGKDFQKITQNQGFLAGYQSRLSGLYGAPVSIGYPDDPFYRDMHMQCSGKDDVIEFGKKFKYHTVQIRQVFLKIEFRGQKHPVGEIQEFGFNDPESPGIILFPGVINLLSDALKKYLDCGDFSLFDQVVESLDLNNGYNLGTSLYGIVYRSKYALICFCHVPIISGLPKGIRNWLT
jgi:hypothetical protein